MTNRRTHYDVLGLSRDSNFDEVKHKYKMLSSFYHPDKDDSYESQEEMKKINEAYSILRDYIKRREYDDQLDNLNHDTRGDFFNGALDVFIDPFFKNPGNLFSNQNSFIDSIKNTPSSKSFSYTSTYINDNGKEKKTVITEKKNNGKKSTKKEEIEKKGGKVVNHKTIKNGKIVSDTGKRLK
jgi:DnaJ-class molecular chaperone